MTLNSKIIFFGITAGVVLSSLVGYCVYFDQIRRSDPEFKEKLRKKRKNFKLNQPINNDNLKMMKALHIQQMERGETLLNSGNEAKCVDHFCNAILLADQPEQTFQYLKNKMSTDFSQLLEKRFRMSLRQIRLAGVYIEDVVDY